VLATPFLMSPFCIFLEMSGFERSLVEQTEIIKHKTESITQYSTFYSSLINSRKVFRPFVAPISGKLHARL
jgi:hypothetical protein